MADPKLRRRWLVWALVASLGLNLAVIGLVAGAILHGPPHRLPPPGGWVIARDLPDPYRGDMFRQLRKGRAQWIEQREDLERQRAALAEALEAEPFEMARVRQVLDEGRDILLRLAARGSDLLVEQIARMPPEDRAAYAAALRRPHDDRNGHGPPHRDPDRP